MSNLRLIRNIYIHFLRAKLVGKLKVLCSWSSLKLKKVRFGKVSKKAALILPALERYGHKYTTKTADRQCKKSQLLFCHGSNYAVFFLQWSSIFPNKQSTEQQSALFVKKLLAVAVSKLNKQ